MLALADPDLDNGPRTDKSATMRMCAVSREVRPIDELIRFVVAPSGEVIPDLKRKLPGRNSMVTSFAWTAGKGAMTTSAPVVSYTFTGTRWGGIVASASAVASLTC
jgi:hypothetical protein